ncbi:hypothetical protein [Sphingomonas hengshuiensis]|uniref:Uncharacterized protein n=1 Tax=Sphingomonas hengshuiensis TaxID=1609977 RepID=A0A7U5HVB5_9SPHN|nr:hypothetical protein [Sphingomonas hengshuiensis]AJP70923.1 hypothetical protein TS85_02450 [Sphingomonas hengshuiensis]
MLAVAAALAFGQSDPVARLDAELRAATSATAVLQRRCAEPIRAVVDRAAMRAPTAEQRARLRVGAEEPVGYRHVSLRCGDKVLSDAENWYVPARLTQAMNAALTGDTPFGAAIRPLAPRREALDSPDPRRDPAAGSRWVLEHHALVLDGRGVPLAEVIERYTPMMRDLPVLR